VSYQETKRETWKLEDCEVTIDTWPWIPTFLEIEGGSESSVRKTASILGLDWSQAVHGSVENIYMSHYDVTEEEVDDWPDITFVPVPEWLEKKRRK
jgi:adenylate cyclase class 2